MQFAVPLEMWKFVKTFRRWYTSFLVTIFNFYSVLGEIDDSNLSKETTNEARGNTIEVVPRFSPYVPRLGRTVTIYPKINRENDF